MTERFQAIDREAALLLIERWQDTAQRWHFHMLSPTCIFNPTFSMKHCIVLENDCASTAYLVLSDLPDMALGRDLAEMIHSEVFETAQATPPESCLVNWTDRMTYLNSRGIPWHHHLLFPECAFNPHSGSWVLMFEDPDGTSPRLCVFSFMPQTEFGIIERLYWAQSRRRMDASNNKATENAP